LLRCPPLRLHLHLLHLHLLHLLRLHLLRLHRLHLLCLHCCLHLHASVRLLLLNLLLLLRLREHLRRLAVVLHWCRRGPLPLHWRLCRRGLGWLPWVVVLAALLMWRVLHRLH